MKTRPRTPWPSDTIGNVAPAESHRSLGRLPNPCWLLNLDQIEKETGYLREREWVDPSKASNSTHAFTTNHVLYSKLRPNLNKVVCPEEPGICTTELIRLRPDPAHLNRKFLTYFLRSEDYMGFARQVVAGAKMPRMVMDRFWEFEIPLPPLPEQDRIVEILDQVDTLRQQRRQADALSQRILPALFHEMFGNTTWPSKPISQILKTIQGGWSPVCDNRPAAVALRQPLLSQGTSAATLETLFQTLLHRFAHKYLSRGDRTIDQMIQSARSGKQNILEGSKAAQTSKEMEIKLTNVARASLEELLDDYRDFLRVRDHILWDKESKEARFVRRHGSKTPQTFELYREFMDTRPPEVMANIAICLIHQANYLLDQQLKTLEKEFVEQGGLRERMTRVRLANRDHKRK